MHGRAFVDGDRKKRKKKKKNTYFLGAGVRRSVGKIEVTPPPALFFGKKIDVIIAAPRIVEGYFTAPVIN